MPKVDEDGPRWRAIRAMVEAGVRVRWIADACELTERFVIGLARSRGWAIPDGGQASPNDPQGLHRTVVRAISRRFGTIAVEGVGDEEALARSMTALVKTTDAAERLVEAFAKEGTHGSRGDERTDDDVRRSLRRKLQSFLGRSRVSRPV